jgi:hypothetical protein
MLAVIFTVENADAQDYKINQLAEPLTFKDRKADRTLTDSTTNEPSAVAVIGNGKYLLVADDKDDGAGNSLKIVEADSGIFIKLLKNIQDSPKNPKWEAITRDNDGNFYVIGSHNNPEDVSKLAARSRLFRFHLVNEAETDPMKFEICTDSVRELDVKESLTSLNLYGSAAPRKVKIEGLAARTNGNRKELVFGFREPFDATTAATQIYIAELPTGEIGKGVITKLLLKPFFQFAAGAPKLSPNTTEPYRLSSIEYVKSLNGFLVMTSTEDTTNKFHGNAIWLVSGEKDNFKTIQAKKIYEFKPEMKAEGLSIFPSMDNKKFRLVIVFDNDAKSPGMIQFLELSESP